MAERSGGDAQPEPEVDEKISSEKYATRAGYWKVTGEGKPKNMQPEGRNRRVLQDIGNLVSKRAVEGSLIMQSPSLCLLRNLSVLHLVFWEEYDPEDNPVFIFYFLFLFLFIPFLNVTNGV